MNRTAGNIMHDICHDWAVYISYYFKGLLLLTINLLMFLFIILRKTFRGKFCYFSICAGYFARQSNSTVVSETNWKEFVYLTLFFPLRRRIYFSLQFGYYSMIRPTFSSLVAYYVPKCWVQKTCDGLYNTGGSTRTSRFGNWAYSWFLFHEGSRLSKNMPRSIFILVNCHFCLWILMTK